MCLITACSKESDFLAMKAANYHAGTMAVKKKMQRSKDLYFYK